MLMANLLKISAEYYNQTTLEHRKKHGQYFTSSDIKDEALSLISFNDDDLVLENSCGTGEFIDSALKLNPKINMVAYDIDQNLINLVNSNFNVTSECKDYLLLDHNAQFDKIIGNPPYFQMTIAEATKKGYKKYLDVCLGKPNIYAMFIKASIDSLKPEGELVYVVPTSMNNGNDFRKLREYIVENTNIENMILFDEKQFDSAQQNVMIFHLKKLRKGEVNNGKFIFIQSGISIFSTEASFLADCFKNGKTLEELGFDVMTGNVVWNQNKPLMSRDNTDLVLVWACNLVNNKVLLGVDKLNQEHMLNEELKPKHQKGQYVKKEVIDKGKTIALNSKPLTKKCIIVNRVTGASVNAKIRAAIVDFKGKEFFVENHLNYITTTDNCNFTLEDLYVQLIKPEVTNFIKKLTGNTQISKKELLKLIPIKMPKEFDKT